MKKKFFKRLALALALTVAVNTVDVPVAAAARPGFVSSKAVVKVGQTKNYRTKNNSGHSARFVIGNQKVASVKYSKGQKYAKVTGVKPGKTTLRADFKSYATKKVTQVRIPVYVESPNPGFMSTKAVVKPGQTKKYRTQNHFGYSTRFVIGNKKVASVKYSKSGKFAKVTGVKPGQTTLRVDFKNYLTKKVTPVRMPVYVKAAGTATVESITVSTQAQLEKALKSGKYGKIIIETDAAIELTVPAGDYKKVDLVVDAPKAKVTNKGQFHEITIKGTAANYTENGKDNVIYVMADEADFKVADNTKVEKVIFKGKKTNVQMGAGSRMRSVVNETGENILVRTPDRVEMLPAGTADKTIEAGTGTSSGSSSSSGSTGGGSGSGSGSGSDNENVGDVEDIKEVGDKNYIGVTGDTIPLSVQPVPETATAKPEWTSSDESVAIVDENGNVTIIGSGKAEITAMVTGKDGKPKKVEYVVFGKQNIPSGSGSVTTTESQITLKNGDSEKLDVTNPEKKPITWFSSDKNVAIVEADGKVTATGEGTAVITGITDDGDYVEYFVDVTKNVPHLEKDGAAAPEDGSEKATYYKVKDEDNNVVTVTGSSISVKIKKENDEEVKFNGNYSDFIEKYCSDEKGIDNSLVLPVGWKNVEVTITKDGKSTTVFIPEVTKQEMVDIDVKIVGNGNVLGGKENVLKASVSNITGADDVVSDKITYSWESSNPKIAEVSGSGEKIKVKGIAPGTAKITVAVEGEEGSKIGKNTAEFTVTVTDHYEVIVRPNVDDYKVGDIVTLTAKITKNGVEVTDTDDLTYTWSYPNNLMAYKLQYEKTFQYLLTETGKTKVQTIILDKDAKSKVTVSGGSLENAIYGSYQFKPRQEPKYPDITVEAAPKLRISGKPDLDKYNINQGKVRVENTGTTTISKDGVITPNLILDGRMKNLESYNTYTGGGTHKWIALRIKTGETELKKVKIRRKDTENYMTNFAIEEEWDKDRCQKDQDFKKYLDSTSEAGDIMYFFNAEFFTSHWVSNTWLEIEVNDSKRVHINLIMIEEL